jgi:hypothetical protein
MKAGDKRTFDLSGLDEAHRQDMVDSARRADGRLALEVKRAELQLEREKNKRRKLDFEAERLRMEREDRQECTRREEERDNRFFGFMSSMMGARAGPSAHFGAPPGSSMGSMLLSDTLNSELTFEELSNLQSSYSSSSKGPA